MAASATGSSSSGKAAAAAKTGTDDPESQGDAGAEVKPTVFQFKVTLTQFKPPIWRRIQVPSTWTFFELHKAIQVVMPWCNTHLHEFRLPTKTETKMAPPFFSRSREPVPFKIKVYPTIGNPKHDLEDSGPDELSGYRDRHPHSDETLELIAKHFALAPGKNKMVYCYDFGNDWIHALLLEKIIPAEKGVKYPICIAGRRLCPPEDSDEYEFEEQYHANKAAEAAFKPEEVNFDVMESMYCYDDC